MGFPSEILPLVSLASSCCVYVPLRPTANPLHLPRSILSSRLIPMRHLRSNSLSRASISVGAPSEASTIRPSGSRTAAVPTSPTPLVANRAVSPQTEYSATQLLSSALNLRSENSVPIRPSLNRTVFQGLVFDFTNMIIADAGYTKLLQSVTLLGASILMLDPEATVATHIVYSEQSHIPAALPAMPQPPPQLVTVQWVKACVAANRLLSLEEFLSSSESQEEEIRIRRRACPDSHKPEKKNVRRTYDEFQEKDREQGLEMVKWMEEDYDWKAGKIGFIQYWLNRKRQEEPSQKHVSPADFVRRYTRPLYRMSPRFAKYASAAHDGPEDSSQPGVSARKRSRGNESPSPEDLRRSSGPRGERAASDTSRIDMTRRPPPPARSPPDDGGLRPNAFLPESMEAAISDSEEPNEEGSASSVAVGDSTTPFDTSSADTFGHRHPESASHVASVGDPLPALTDTSETDTAGAVPALDFGDLDDVFEYGDAGRPSIDTPYSEPEGPPGADEQFPRSRTSLERRAGLSERDRGEQEPIKPGTATEVEAFGHTEQGPCLLDTQDPTAAEGMIRDDSSWMLSPYQMSIYGRILGSPLRPYDEPANIVRRCHIELLLRDLERPEPYRPLDQKQHGHHAIIAAFCLALNRFKGTPSRPLAYYVYPHFEPDAAFLSDDLLGYARLLATNSDIPIFVLPAQQAWIVSRLDVARRDCAHMVWPPDGVTDSSVAAAEKFAELVLGLRQRTGPTSDTDETRASVMHRMVAVQHPRYVRDTAAVVCIILQCLCIVGQNSIPQSLDIEAHLPQGLRRAGTDLVRSIAAAITMLSF